MQTYHRIPGNDDAIMVRARQLLDEKIRKHGRQQHHHYDNYHHHHDHDDNNRHDHADRHANGDTADYHHRRARRRRSLKICHRYSLYERPRFAPPPQSGAYFPALAARLEDDRNLTDGRRCARKLAEYSYRHAHEQRSIDITVTYLMKPSLRVTRPARARRGRCLRVRRIRQDGGYIRCGKG